MINKKGKSGFTLTEVLISAGILSIGFMLIAGAFPVGVKLTSMATERTIGATAAQEAVSRIRINGLDMSHWYNYYVVSGDPAVEGLTYGGCFDYSTLELLNWSDPTVGITPDFRPVFLTEEDYYYPSTNLVAEKKYHWSALCRRISSEQVQLTIFVSRLAGAGVTYPVNPIPTDSLDPAVVPLPDELDYPRPYMILGIERDPDDAHRKRLVIPTVTPDGDTADYMTYFREGSVIYRGSYKIGSGVYANPSGQLYTVQQVDIPNNTVTLDRTWATYYAHPDTGETYYYTVWVLPSAIDAPASGGTPATLGGRWPCVWIHQEVVELKDFSQILPEPPGP